MKYAILVAGFIFIRYLGQNVREVEREGGGENTWPRRIQELQIMARVGVLSPLERRSKHTQKLHEMIWGSNQPLYSLLLVLHN